MPIRIIPKEYRLTKRDRQALTLYLEGKHGIREAGRLLKTNHQNVPRMITSIIRHAAANKQLDVKALLEKY